MPASIAASLAVAGGGAHSSRPKHSISVLTITITASVRLGLSLPARANSAGVKTRVGPGYQSWLQSMRSLPVFFM